MNGDTGPQQQVEIGQGRGYARYYWIIIAVVVVVVIAIYISLDISFGEPSKREKIDILNEISESSPEDTTPEAEKLRILEGLREIKDEPVDI